jgi:recombination protein RecA
MGVEAWCAFVDPTQSLFAPAIAAAGVDAQRLLVVQPTLEAMDRVAVKLAEAQIFSVVVVDLVSTQWFEPEGRSDVSTLALSRWVKIVRRLSLSIQGTATQIVLLTDLTAHRALPLPVALRLELQRTSQDRLRLTVAKDKLGRTRAPISLDTTNLLPEVYTGRSLRGNLEPKSTRKFDSTLAIAS